MWLVYVIMFLTLEKKKKLWSAVTFIYLSTLFGLKRKKKRCKCTYPAGKRAIKLQIILWVTQIPRRCRENFKVKKISKFKETLATWCEEPTGWKRPWWLERLKARGEESDRGWDSCITSPAQQTLVSKLQEMGKDREACHAAVHGLQRAGHNLATKRQ